MATKMYPEEAEPKFKHWWQYIFYTVGVVTGYLNIVFWVIMLAIHFVKDKNEPFFSQKFYHRTYIYGIVFLCLMITAIAATMLLTN